MAKDGTNRGGRRVRAGDKPTPLAEKITTGKAAKVLETPDLKPATALSGTLLPSPVILTGADMPEPSEYLRANQKDGKPLGADTLFIETWRWLKERACDQFISPRLVEAYAQAFARYIQCEEAISAYGLLGRHPTTGGAIASSFVQMSLSFQKQFNLLWYEIYDVVKQNCISTTLFEMDFLKRSIILVSASDANANPSKPATGAIVDYWHLSPIRYISVAF